MPTVAIVEGVKIQFYPDEHSPPRFHARFAEHVAQIRIEPLEILKGSLPPQKLSAVLSLAKSRRDVLLLPWTLLEEGRKPGKIP